MLACDGRGNRPAAGAAVVTDPKHTPAPRAPGDAAKYMESRAATFRDVIAAAERDREEPRRLAALRRQGGYYAEAVEALEAWAAYRKPYAESAPAAAVAPAAPPADDTAPGWLGTPCAKCEGTGESEGDDGRRACQGCGGTGEAHGVAPGFAAALADLPADDMDSLLS